LAIESESMNAVPVIDVLGLQKSYSEGLLFRRSFHALRGVTLRVDRGEVFGLLGPNGAGKTTLIKVLLGIIRATQGDANLLGLPAGSKAARCRVGYLPENLNVPKHHTAIGALKFYGRLSRLDEKTIRLRSAELLELVGLKGRENELARKYSKGMRQRLGLAQALLHDPDLLILDEPTDGLDPLGRSQIRQILAHLREQGKTIFLNSHILQEVELICDRVAIMAKGQLKGAGRIQDLIAQFSQSLEARVRLEVAGTPEVVESVLSKNFSVVVIPLGDATYCRVELRTNRQEDIDRSIDLLRQAGISILRLDPHRPSLEQVFLSAVDETDGDGTASTVANPYAAQVVPPSAQ
jgi:ABC-2 type transport system ATP-binding protein